jgi:ABC-type phosphate transport system substrate-binding protein
MSRSQKISTRWAAGLRTIGAVGIALLASVGVVAVAGPASAATTVSGGGSSFAAPELQQWSADVAHPPANLTVNYASNSSGAGRDDYAQGYDQYGASDIVYYSNDGSFEQEAQSQHPFKYVTVSAGGLAFMYNIVIGGQRWTGLQLTQQEACQIFTGQLTNWTQLANTPGDAILAGVNEPISTVLRSDAAGESYVLSQYCIAVDPSDWSTFVNYVQTNGGSETGVGWPGDSDLSVGKPVEFWPPKLEDSQTNNNISAGGAPEEVNAVSDPNNGGYSIGYMAAVYAQTAGYPMASVQNAAGAFVQPNATSVQIALSYATANDLGTFNLSFTGNNPGAYFPSTYSYILAPTTTNAPASAGADATLGQFLCYAIGQGQSEAARELYAPLSSQVTQLSVAAIQSIPGAPAAASCGTGGPAPVVSSPGAVSTGTGASGSSTPGAAPSASASGKTATSGSSTASGAGATGSASTGATVTTVAGSAASSGSAAGSASSAAGATSGSQGGSYGAGSSGSGQSTSPVSVEELASASTGSTTNSDAYWWLALGAIVCAVGTLGVGASKGLRG